MNSGGAAEHFEDIQALAGQYPDVYAPQELLCTAAMKIRMTVAKMQGHCKLMSELAMQAGSK